MSNYLFISSDTPSELLVPVTPVNHELEAINDRLIYVPLATRNTFGVIKVGEGLNINNGLLSFDRSELDIKLSTNVGSENAGKFLYVSDTGNISFVDQIQTITKVSELENDVGYITNSVENLLNYYDNATIDYKFNNVSYETLLNKPELGTVSSKNVGTGSGEIPILDSNGKISQLVLPSIAITNTYIVESEGEQLSLIAQPGDIAIREDLRKSFILRGNDASNINDWSELLTPLDSVHSVNGYTGTVVLTQDDVKDGSTYVRTERNYSESDKLKVDDAMTLSATETVTGIKIFTETIGLLNTNGTMDRIRHINNNFLIVDQAGTALLDIDEGFKTIKSFGKKLAFEEDIPEIQDVPTKTSQLENDSGFITADQVPEGGILYNTTGQNTDGAMTQAASTNIFAAKTEIPTKLSELSTDDNNQRVSSSEKTAWNNKSDFSGSYRDLTDKPTIPTKTSELENDSISGGDNVLYCSAINDTLFSYGTPQWTYQILPLSKVTKYDPNGKINVAGNHLDIDTKKPIIISAEVSFTVNKSCVMYMVVQSGSTTLKNFSMSCASGSHKMFFDDLVVNIENPNLTINFSCNTANVTNQVSYVQLNVIGVE